jgi:hypothetical protein
VLTSVARIGAAPERPVLARRAVGADRARAEDERFTGTKRAAGPKLTAEVVGRPESGCAVSPGMSAWEGAGDGASEGRELAGGGVAARAARRLFAGVGRGLRVAAGRGLAGGRGVDLPAGGVLFVALG